MITYTVDYVEDQINREFKYYTQYAIIGLTQV